MAKISEEEIYRHYDIENDLYSPCIFILRNNDVGIKVNGSVHIMSLRDWHERAESFIVKTETTHNSDYAVQPTASPKMPSLKAIRKELNGNINFRWTETEIIPVIDAIKKLGNFA